jgi:Secretion system C-terminal sorting domain
MNNKYILLLLACTAGAAHAQRVSKPHLPSWARLEHAHAGTQARPLVESGARSGGDVVWTEDFANGLAGNNGSGAWTVDGFDSQWWVYTHTGPNGAYSNNTEAITSASSDNGWMIFQSDSGNTDWDADPPVIVGTTTAWDAGLVSPTIDLSATPYVMVQFQQAMRYCCSGSPHVLQVTTNDFATSTSFPVITDAVNVDPGTLTTTVNIADAIAADPSNVKLRFYHDGPNSNSSHYHWQIDDINIVELYNYDLIMESGSTSSWSTATAFTYDSLNYTVYPFSQLRPIPLNVVLQNNGSQAQTGTVVNFTVTDEGGAEVLNQDQTVDLAPGAQEQVFVNPDFTPPPVAGAYDVAFSATSIVGDTSTTDNSAEAGFKVSEFIYSRDGGTAADYFDATDDGEYELCNGFHIANDVELYAVDVSLRSGGSPSPVGIPIYGLLKDGSDVEIELSSTSEHVIAQSELNGANGIKVISLIFSEPQFLEAGSDYFVCIKHFGGAEVRTAINGVSEDQSTFIYFENEPGAGPDWFFTNDMPLVRMNFNPSAGIADADRQNGIGLGQNIPNPADMTTLIPYDLKEGAKLTFEVHDMSGKLVATQFLGDRAPGAHRLKFDTSALNEGVYFYSLTSEGTRLTKRMTVIR